jgi:hypothetical protein
MVCQQLFESWNNFFLRGRELSIFVRQLSYQISQAGFKLTNDRFDFGAVGSFSHDSQQRFGTRITNHQPSRLAKAALRVFDQFSNRRVGQWNPFANLETIQKLRIGMEAIGEVVQSRPTFS